MAYMLFDGREYMPVSDEGYISRKSPCNVVCSSAWFIRGAIRYNNFGVAVEFKHFPECAAIIDWNYKNGRPKWKICDHDHGTNRIWGRVAKLFKI